MLIRSIAIASLLFAAALPAAAQSRSPAPSAASAPSMSLGDIEDRFTADGFRIVEIERYANVIEVKGYDRQGECVEIYLDRRSGDVLRRERDDSCSRNGRRGERHHFRGDDHHGDDHHRGRSLHGGDHD